MHTNLYMLLYAVHIQLNTVFSIQLNTVCIQRHTVIKLNIYHFTRVQLYVIYMQLHTIHMQLPTTYTQHEQLEKDFQI